MTGRTGGTLGLPKRHDLWIAVGALEHDLPLLTRNVAEFARVPKLRVVNYTSPPAPAT